MTLKNDILSIVNRSKQQQPIVDGSHRTSAIEFSGVVDLVCVDVYHKTLGQLCDSSLDSDLTQQFCIPQRLYDQRFQENLKEKCPAIFEHGTPEIPSSEEVVTEEFQRDDAAQHFLVARGTTVDLYSMKSPGTVAHLCISKVESGVNADYPNAYLVGGLWLDPSAQEVYRESCHVQIAD